MPDREKVIKGLHEAYDIIQDFVPKRLWGYALYACLNAIFMLKEQNEERKRLINWMGKFCAHVDTDFHPMSDEENTRFFCEKMRTQFGWEVSMDDALALLREQEPVPPEWISVEDQLPEDDGTVLAVKQLKDRSRQICLAYCNLDWMYTDPVTGVTTHEPRWVCGGNNNIIYWMKLPGIPEEAKA